MEAKSHKEVETYSGIDAPWPAIHVDFTLRRVSSVDRKIAVLPLIRKSDTVKKVKNISAPKLKLLSILIHGVVRDGGERLV